MNSCCIEVGKARAGSFEGHMPASQACERDEFLKKPLTNNYFQ